MQIEFSSSFVAEREKGFPASGGVCPLLSLLPLLSFSFLSFLSYAPNIQCWPYQRKEAEGAAGSRSSGRNSAPNPLVGRVSTLSDEAGSEP